MLLERALSLGLGVFVGGLVASLSLAQVGLGFLRSRGRGKAGLPPHKDPSQVDKYTDDKLNRLRDDLDPLTDPWIEKIAAIQVQSVEGGQAPLSTLEQFYKELLTHRYYKIEQHSGTPWEAILREWEKGIVMPLDVDRRRLEHAGEFFRDNLFPIVLILGTSTLLEAYACRKGVQVLAQTEYLSKRTNRRLKETLQFVLFVSEPKGFTDGVGHGLAAIKKVRLMHAVIRWQIQNKARADGKWKPSFGKPINGEDLLGMLMGFSGIVLRDLPQLRVEPTTDEVDDHIYLWNTVGKALGAEPALLPADLGEVLALVAAVERRQQMKSKAGIRMAKALVEYHRALLSDDLLPIGTATMRRLAGDEICNMLGIPWSDLSRRGPINDLIFDVALSWGKLFIGHTGLVVDGEEFGRYEIPESLRDTVYPPDQGANIPAQMPG